MENFANFIIKYIEKNEIHGKTGWLNQLQAYQWDTKSGIERYSDGLLISKKFRSESQKILNIPNNDEIWFRHCDDIRTWGGMKKVPPNLSLSFKKSVVFLLSNNPGVDSDFTMLPISGERIATASKIYYFSDPLLWTIYDSRVGYAIHQLIFEYAKTLQVSPSSLFADISICLPESQTDRRNPVYPVSNCKYSETESKASFIWASHLHHLIASKLNGTTIQKPSQYLSTQPQWELPHVEMVFFVIGDRKWIDAPDLLAQVTPQTKSRKRGDYAGICPWCGHPLKIRESRITGELYDGCTNYPTCRYKGNRSH